MQTVLLHSPAHVLHIQWLSINGSSAPISDAACIVDKALMPKNATHLQQLKPCIVLMEACPCRIAPCTTMCSTSRRRAGHCCRKRVQLKLIISIVYQQAFGAAVLLHGGAA